MTSTVDASSSDRHRRSQIDVEVGNRGEIVFADDEAALKEVAVPIVVEASVPGFSPVTASIATSTDAAKDSVNAVAERSVNVEISIE